MILLSDGYLANGSEPWALPSVADLPAIDPAFATGPNGAGDDGTPRPVEQREDASHALAALLAAHGVWAVRAHTARATADAVRVGAAWRRARDGADQEDRHP